MAGGVRPPGGVPDDVGPGALVGVSLKMYFGHADTLLWLKSLRSLVPLPPELRLFVLPSFPALREAREILHGTGIQVGAQDVWPDTSGPFTGEVSAENVAELGCRFAEIGHAERRRMFAEKDPLLARKVEASLSAGLIPVLCVGEEDRTDPSTASERAVRQALAGLDGVRKGPVVLAYEPVWAIGAARPAPPEHVRPVIGALRRAVAEARPGSTVRILYGGSADESIVDALMTPGEPESRADGLFLGRAAHDVTRLSNILTRVAAAARPVDPAGAWQKET